MEAIQILIAFLIGIIVGFLIGVKGTTLVMTTIIEKTLKNK